MKLYLKHSGMIRSWNLSNFVNYFESYSSEQRLIPCRKDAMILPRNRAVQMHAILKAKNKLSYLGKDVIADTLRYYTIFGHASARTMSRFRYIFETGIQEWWQNFLDWEYLIKTHETTKETQENQQGSSETKTLDTQVHSFYIIPLAGLVASTLVFLTIEIKLFGKILQLLRIMIYFICQIYFRIMLYFKFSRTIRGH